MKIGRKYFEIEEEEVKVGSVGDDGGGDVDARGDVEEGSAEVAGDGSEEEAENAPADGNGAEEGSAEEAEEKNESEPVEDAVVNEVKTTKRGRKAKGAE